MLSFNSSSNWNYSKQQMRAALMVFLLCGLGFAQTTPSPSVDLYGGYSYLNIDTNALTSSRQSANGWQGSISVNPWKYLAAEVQRKSLG